MTKKLIRNYIQNLKSIRDAKRGKVPNQTMTKINNVIDLYEDRKISQFTTAVNLINGLTTGNAKSKEKGNKAYQKAVEKYEDKAPITQRMRNTPAKARQVKKEKAVEQNKQQVLRRIRQKMAVRQIQDKASQKLFGNRKRYSVSYMLFSVEPRNSKRVAFKVNGVSFYPLLTNPAVRTANIKSNAFIEEIVKRKITSDFDKHLFKKVLMVMKTDQSFRSQMQSLEYVDAIRLENVELIEADGDYDATTENLRNADNVSIYHRFVETEIDTSYATVKQALAKQNYREGECWINALVEHYSDTLMKQKRGSLAKNLTRDKVLELIGSSEDEFIKNGTSIMKMERVFEAFGIPARIFDFNCSLIFKYDPPTHAHRIKTFNGLVKNKHIYVLNHDLKSLKRSEMGGEKELSVKVSDNYYINDREEPRECKMIDTIEDLLHLKEKDEYILIHRDNDLPKLLHDFKESGYEPFVKYQAGTISELKIMWRIKELKKTIHYTIQSQNLSKSKIDEDVVVSSEEAYKKTSEAMFKMNKSIFNENHKSYYTDTDIEILDECRTIVPAGLINSPEVEKNVAEIDINKAFTKAFTSIKKIPIFRQFDIWRQWSSELNVNDMPSLTQQSCESSDLSGLTLYMVKVANANIMFNKKHNLMYGKFLKKLIEKGVKCDILYYKQPSHIHKVDYKQIIDDLWAEQISADEQEDRRTKKTIANINFGLLEKSRNKGQKSRMFDTLTEVCHYQAVYGGRVYAIDGIIKDYSYTPLAEEREKVKVWNFEDGWVGFEDGVYQRFVVIDGVVHIQRDAEIDETKYYVLNVSDERCLSNGFRYIKELLLQDHNYRVYEAYETLKENGIGVYSVKTDALTIKTDDVARAVKLLKVEEEKHKIGGWRVEKSKRVRLPTDDYKLKYNELVDVPQLRNEKLNIEDEWDTDTICKQIIDCGGKCLIRARFAGSGKSYIGEYFRKLGYNVLFVVPTNRLLQEKEVEATTYNKFFSIAVQQDAGEKLPYFDYSSYDIIVFDEIYMSNLYVLNKVRLFMQNNPDKMVVATGDVKQLQGVEILTNCQNPATYIDDCLNTMFEYNIFLTICKRVGAKDSIEGDKNREIIKTMYEDFWEKELPVEEIIPKYFETTDDIMASEHNIAYTNIRCRNVANEIRSRLNKKDKYEVGEILIARKWIKTPRVNVNIRYKIMSIKQDERGLQITLQNITNADDKFMLYEPIVDANFIYSYCATCHSSQGASVKGSITIHEYNLPMASREWLYCAITRCVDFKQVKFYYNPSFDKQMDKNMIMRYFKNKIEGYKAQDRRSHREIDEAKYITPEWCLKMFKSRCEKCNTAFNFETKQGKLCSNFTAQRLCNDYGHHLDNCCAYCFYCNVSAH